MNQEPGKKSEETRKGQQPEALGTFAAAARERDKMKPDDQGYEARPDTAPLPADPDAKNEAAERVLREGTLGRDQGADEIIVSLPDRTRTSPRDKQKTARDGAD